MAEYGTSVHTRGPSPPGGQKVRPTLTALMRAHGGPWASTTLETTGDPASKSIVALTAPSTSLNYSKLAPSQTSAGHSTLSLINPHYA